MTSGEKIRRWEALIQTSAQSPIIVQNARLGSGHPRENGINGQIHMCVCPFVCLGIYVYVAVSLFPCICVSVYLCVCSLVCLCICVSVSVSLYVCITALCVYV